MSLIEVGHVVRVLFRKGRRYDDYVLFQTGPDSWVGVGAPVGGEFRVLAHAPLLVPARGPAVVGDRYLPHVFSAPTRWVDLATSGLIPDFRTKDFEPELMDDSEFWRYIELLGGAVDDAGVSRLTAELASQPLPRIVQFRDTLWVKLRMLDHPQNVVSSHGTEGDVTHSDASLYYRCEIVAKGKESFLRSTKNPHPGDGDDGAAGEPLLTVADDASLYPLPRSAIEIETGSNAENWPVHRVEDATWSQVPSPSPFVNYIEEWGVQNSEYSSHFTFTSFVAYAVTPGGRVREFMGCLMAASFSLARVEIIDFLERKLDDEEVLDERVRIWQSGAAQPMPGVELSGNSRRSALSMDRYIDIFINGGQE